MIASKYFAWLLGTFPYFPSASNRLCFCAGSVLTLKEISGQVALGRLDKVGPEDLSSNFN